MIQRVLAAPLVGLAAVLLWAGCGGKSASSGSSAAIPPGHDKTEFDGVVRYAHSTTTEDGWNVGMWEFYSNSYDPSREPVLLVAGFLESSSVFALPGEDERSLARSLAAEGFHVWTLDFRGSGTSYRQPVFIPTPGDFLPVGLNPEGWKFNADDLFHSDLPAAIDYIRSVTGHSRVQIVGHSLGGLAAFAGLEGLRADAVTSVVSLAGLGFGKSAGGGTLFTPLFGILKLVAPAIPDNLIFPLGFAGMGVLAGPEALYNKLLGLLETQLGSLFWAPGSLDADVRRKIFAHGLANTSTTIFKQWLQWEMAGEAFTLGPHPDLRFDVGEYFGLPEGQAEIPMPVTTTRSRYFEANGFRSYTGGLGTVLVPALVLAGGADNVVPRDNARAVYDRLGASAKDFVELSRAKGFTRDYGHLDMLLSDAASREVYPIVSNWLRARSGR